MSEAGPSKSSGGGSKASTKQKYHKFSRGGGGDRGRGGRGRGGGGAGGGRGRGGGDGGRGRRGGAPWMRGEGDKPKMNPLGSYREDPPIDPMTSPGIMVTAVQHKERSAEKEFIEHLERVADEVYPETMGVEAKDEADEDEDLEEMLKRELHGMRGEKSKRFRLCLHDTQCVFYVNVLPPLDPVRLVQNMLSTVEISAQSAFKFVKRLVPISATSAATMAQLGQICTDVVKEGFKTYDNRALKFAIVTNTRNSDRLERLDMIKRVADEIAELGHGHTVDLKSPDRTVLIEVNKNTLGISVVQDYERFKKFNVGSVAEFAAKAKHATPNPAELDTAKTVDNIVSATANGERSVDQPPKITKHQNRANAAARAAEAFKSHGPKLGLQGGEKRNADAMEDGQVALEEDVEVGELVEADVELEGFDEVIEDGKVVKMRRTE